MNKPTAQAVYAFFREKDGKADNKNTERIATEAEDAMIDKSVEATAIEAIEGELSND